LFFLEIFCIFQEKIRAKASRTRRRGIAVKDTTNEKKTVQTMAGQQIE